MNVEEEINYDRNLLNVSFSIGRFHITKEMILRFARASGETNPLYTSTDNATLVAPPTFCNILIASITRPDIKLNFGNNGFFASQTIECLADVKPGDILDGSTKLKDVFTKTGRSGRMVFIVWETDFTNQDGELVTLVRESFVRRNREKVEYI